MAVRLVHLHVEGMMCMKNCGSTVRRALMGLSDVVRNVEITLDTGAVDVTLSLDSAAAVTAAELIDAVETVGFDCRLAASPADEASTRATAAQPGGAGAEMTTAIGMGSIAAGAIVQMPQPQGLNPASQHAALSAASASPASGPLRRLATLSVGGMTCASCVGAVERCLLATPGVHAARVALLAGKAEVEYGGPCAGAAPLAEALSDIGYEATVLADAALLSPPAAGAGFAPPGGSSSRRGGPVAGNTSGSSSGNLLRHGLGGPTHPSSRRVSFGAGKVRASYGAAHSSPPAPALVVSLSVDGMTCSSCVGAVERAASAALGGACSVSVALLAGRAEVRIPLPLAPSAPLPPPLDRQAAWGDLGAIAGAVCAAVTAAGYEASILSSSKCTVEGGRDSGAAPPSRGASTASCDPLLSADDPGPLPFSSAAPGAVLLPGEEGEEEEDEGPLMAAATLHVERAYSDAASSSFGVSPRAASPPAAGPRPAPLDLSTPAPLRALLAAMPGIESVHVEALSRGASSASATRTPFPGDGSLSGRRGGGGSSLTQRPLAATLQYDVRRVKLRRVIDALTDAGCVVAVGSQVGAAAPMGGAPGTGGSDTLMMQSRTAAERGRWLRLLLASALLTAPVFVISMVLPWVSAGLTDWGDVPGVPGLATRDLLLALLTFPVQFIIGWRFIAGAAKGISLRHRRCNMGMDFLVATGTTAAYFASLLQMALDVVAAQQQQHLALAHAMQMYPGASDGVRGLQGSLPSMPSGGSMTFFETSALLITFVLLGKYLETVAKGKTSDALSALLDLQPATALVVCEDPEEGAWWTRHLEAQAAAVAAAGAAAARAQASATAPARGVAPSPAAPAVVIEMNPLRGGAGTAGQQQQPPSSLPASAALVERPLPLHLVSPGDLIKVVPGAAIAADGIVESGSSEVNEAMITGEPMPVPKGPGDRVVGASLNASTGLLFVRATAVGGDSVLAQIVRLVESAQMSKAPVQAFADRVSGVFAPVVLSAALLTFVGWMAAAGTGALPPGYIPPGRSPFLFSLLFAIAVVVIACPCALGLATPTAVMVGTGVGARNGVLIKGGAALETAHRVTTVVFDKTGTLTEGRPALTDVVLLPGAREAAAAVASGALEDRSAAEEGRREGGCAEFVRLLGLVASAESGSEHPLGRAVVEGVRAAAEQMEGEEARVMGQEQRVAGSTAAAQRPALFGGGEGGAPSSTLCLWPLLPDSFQAEPGFGLRAVVAMPSPATGAGRGQSTLDSAPSPASRNPAGPALPSPSVPVLPSPVVPVPVLVGNRAWMARNGVAVTAAAEAQLLRLERHGRTAVIAAVGPTAVLVLGISDRVKGEAPAVVAALRWMGVEVWMVTGDNAVTAASVGRRVGIPPSRVMAEVLPGDKAEKVTSLQAGGAVVAMVGDGINDSPALAAADVGMAVGAGAQIAIAAADIVLLRSDLRDVVTALHLSRAVFRRIWMNFVWALGYNALGIPLAAGLFFPLMRASVPPEVAGLAMALSSVSVVLSSLMLRRYTRPDVRSLALKWRAKVEAAAAGGRFAGLRAAAGKAGRGLLGRAGPRGAAPAAPHPAGGAAAVVAGGGSVAVAPLVRSQSWVTAPASAPSGFSRGGSAGSEGTRGAGSVGPASAGALGGSSGELQDMGAGVPSRYRTLGDAGRGADEEEEEGLLSLMHPSGRPGRSTSGKAPAAPAEGLETGGARRAAAEWGGGRAPARGSSGAAATGRPPPLAGELGPWGEEEEEEGGGEWSSLLLADGGGEEGPEHGGGQAPAAGAAERARRAAALAVDVVDLSLLTPICGCSGAACRNNRLESMADWELAWDAAVTHGAAGAAAPRGGGGRTAVASGLVSSCGCGGAQAPGGIEGDTGGSGASRGRCGCPGVGSCGCRRVRGR